ncbi:MAG TPA: transglycosylase SLT domain-containing protein, partial [Thermoleophilaceae bacterium]|nr:transglycosylase SLT domain-containing protein [Thermoleophilaceae bacterium]
RASLAVSRWLARAEQRGNEGLARRLREERRRADERFDPQKAIEGMARYLSTARDEFGRDELAVASYHMGIGNLERALRSFAGEEAEEDDEIADVVDDQDLDYARVYFDSAPDRHGRTWRFLYSLGDDSSTYLWRVRAAERIMRLWRRDPDRLARLAELHGDGPSAEAVLHPPSETRDGELRPLTAGQAGRHGLALGSGEQALQPAAARLVAWMGDRVREITGGDAPLTLTRERHAGGGDALHSTGFAFDVERTYPDPGQADAFQFVLDRLQALNLIAWSRESEVIHIAVSSEASSF